MPGFEASQPEVGGYRVESLEVDPDITVPDAIDPDGLATEEDYRVTEAEGTEAALAILQAERFRVAEEIKNLEERLEVQKNALHVLDKKILEGHGKDDIVH